MMEHLYRHRVRYADTDQMGVVYHGRYLEWFEAARTEFLRDSGLVYKELEDNGLLLPVIEAHCVYHNPVHYDDLVEIRTRITQLSRITIKLEYTLYLHDEDICRISGYTRHCFINSAGKPIRIQKSIMEIFSKLTSFSKR